MDEIQKEYKRIKAIFKETDKKQLSLLDGLILEAARTRVDLNNLQSVAKKTGLLKINPSSPFMQKELAVSRVLPKVRASYTNMMFKLAKALSNDIDEDDLGLDEYE